MHLGLGPSDLAGVTLSLNTRSAAGMKVTTLVLSVISHLDLLGFQILVS